MNRIGFEMPQEEDPERYRQEAGYQMRNNFGESHGEYQNGGAKGGEMELDEHTAHRWVKAMKNGDGSHGEHWSMQQIKQFMAQKNVEEDPVTFYAIMNALYSDFCPVFQKKGVNTIDMYVEMAKAWLNDKDAVPNKAAAYFEHIVQH